MTAIECPRCHGRGWGLKGKPKPTMRIENVMSTTQMIYYKCSECCYAEKRPYGKNGVIPKTWKQQSLGDNK